MGEWITDGHAQAYACWGASKADAIVRKAPLSLEIRSDLPDDGDELGDAKTNPEAEPMDLEDSIDALLREVDATCASFEPETKAPIASNAAISDKGTKVAPQPERTPDSPEPESTGEDSDTNTEEALSALEAVESGAQSLIEDAIDTLLDEQTDAPESAVAEPLLPETETAPAAEPSNDASAATGSAVGTIDASSEDELSDEAIDAALDELDTTAPSSNPAPETPPEAEAAVEPEAEFPDADALLESIADELTAEAGSVDAQPDTNETDTAPEPNDASPAPEADFQPDASGTSDVPSAEASESTPRTQPEPIAESVPEPASQPDAEGGAEPEQETAAAETDQVDADIASTLADLDDSLAGIADDLLMGDFETPDGERIDSRSLGDANDASALLEQLGVDDLDLDSVSEPASAPAPATPTDAKVNAAPPPPAEGIEQTTDNAPKPAPSKPEPVTAAAAGNKPKSDPLDEVIIAEQRIESVWETAQRLTLTFVQQAWQMTKTHAWPVAARGLIVINKPLSSKPTQIRDTIGYLAIWTVLLCVILWSYLFFVRQSPTPEVSEAPSRMLQPGETIDAIDSTP